MELSYSILTLKEGNFHLTFQSKDKLAEDIEQVSGIYIPDQTYFTYGRLLKLNEILNNGITNFQVTSKTDSTFRYFIKTPEGPLKLYLPSNKKVRDLARAFTITCKQRSLPYSLNLYAFKFINQILPLEKNISEIPSDSEIDLIPEPVYEDIPIISVTLNGLLEEVNEFYLEPTDHVKTLKEMIKEETGISTKKQKLISANRVLDDEKTLDFYGLTNGSVIEFRMYLTTGAMLPSYLFDSVDQPVEVKVGPCYPSWKSLSPGFSSLGRCSNSKCKAFQQEVICNQYFGIFDVLDHDNRVTCPMCSEKIIEVDICGFFKCRFRFYGAQIDGIVREGSGVAGCEKYMVFLDKEIVQWKILRIQVDYQQDIQD